ncbi:MAG: prepilin-type N-terminal cleavage/methylation domain-containing protein [Candidatus Binataceae bacterium]
MKGHLKISRLSPGFTLIELMLAVSILGLILAMLAESFHAVATSKLHAEDRLYTERAGRTILWQMSNEIRGAVQTPLTPSRVLMLGTAHYQGGVPLNSLTVSTLDAGHRRSIDGYGAEEIVTYQTVANPQHRGWFILERSQQSALGPGTNGTSIPVADNVVGIKLRYFDGQEWGEVWNSANMSAGRQLPVAMTIDITLAGPKGHPLTFSTQVTVPMAIQQW